MVSLSGAVKAVAATSAQRPHLVVLGGGISGLVTAWSAVRGARQNGNNIRVTVLESQSNVGGCMKTEVGPMGTILEKGPRGLRPSGANGRATLNLIASLGLQDEVIVAGQDHPGAANRFILKDSKLAKLPTGPLDLLLRGMQGDFVCGALLKAVLAEPFVRTRQHSSPHCTVEDDESVFDFARRRFGSDVATYMIDPLCVGIYGGNARALSLQACFPSLADLENQGSLVVGGITGRMKSPELPPPEPGTHALLERVDGARVWSLRRGIAGITTGLRTWLEDALQMVRTDTACVVLEQCGTTGKILVGTSCGDTLEADHVVSALPAHALAGALQHTDATGAQLLNAFTANGLVVVNFVFKGKVLPVEGFGYLIPTSENAKGVLGVVFDSCAFPQQDVHGDVAEDVTRLTVMSGGYAYDDLYSEGTFDAAPALSQAVLRRHLGITAEPVHHSTYVWTNCMPQYAVGHLQRVATLETHVAHAWDGRMSVIGNSFYGVGVNDCVLKATTTGHHAVASMARAHIWNV